MIHPTNWYTVKLSEYRITPIKEAIRGAKYNRIAAFVREVLLMALI